MSKDVEVLLNNFYKWDLGFNKEKYKEHLKKVEKIKKEMGESYRLARAVQKGELV